MNDQVYRYLLPAGSSLASAGTVCVPCRHYLRLRLLAKNHRQGQEAEQMLHVHAAIADEGTIAEFALPGLAVNGWSFRLCVDSAVGLRATELNIAPIY